MLTMIDRLKFAELGAVVDAMILRSRSPLVMRGKKRGKRIKRTARSSLRMILGYQVVVDCSKTFGKSVLRYYEQLL